MLTYIVISALADGVVGMIAQHKGSGPLAWLFYGALLWPIALPHILLRKSRSFEEPSWTMAEPLGKQLPPARPLPPSEPPSAPP